MRPSILGNFVCPSGCCLLNPKKETQQYTIINISEITITELTYIALKNMKINKVKVYKNNKKPE